MAAAKENFDAYTYRRLRRAIGYLGISLPIILLTFSAFHFFETDFQPSISHYYYTNLREIFTGTLCAVGFFLLRYKGHKNPQFWKNDNLLTNIAGIMAIGVALVPTNRLEMTAEQLRCAQIVTDAGCEQTVQTLIQQDLNWLHYGFAGVLFAIFAVLAIFVFTLGQENQTGDQKSVVNENNIYKFCGYGIIVCLAMVPLDTFYYSTITFEAIALFLFGSAWLIKGRALGDSGKIGEKIYMEKNSVDTEKVFEE